MSGHDSDSSSPPELCSGSESDESLPSDAHESDEDAHESDREDSAEEEPPELLPGDSSENDSGFDDSEEDDDGDDDDDDDDDDDEGPSTWERDGGRQFFLHNLVSGAHGGEHEGQGASVFGQMLEELAGIPANRIFAGNGLGMVGVGGIRFERVPTGDDSSHSQSPPRDRPVSRRPFRRYRSLSKRERRQQQPQQAPDEIRKLLWDEAFVDSLLAELPGVNKDAFQIQAALKDLRGPRMKSNEVNSSRVSSVEASSSAYAPNSGLQQTRLGEGEGSTKREPDPKDSSRQVQASP